jgi:hypothetical protein
MMTAAFDQSLTLVTHQPEAVAFYTMYWVYKTRG